MSLTLMDIMNSRFINGEAIDRVDHQQILYMSILSHLTRLMNTRQGSLRHQPDYGLPDVAEIYRSMPNSIAGFLAEIERTLGKYEPRLTDVKVKHKNNLNDDHSVLCLQISGKVLNGDAVLFDTYFLSEGKAKVLQTVPDNF